MRTGAGGSGDAVAEAPRQYVEGCARIGGREGPDGGQGRVEFAACTGRHDAADAGPTNAGQPGLDVGGRWGGETEDAPRCVPRSRTAMPFCGR